MDHHAIVGRCEEILAVSALYSRPLADALAECCEAVRSGGGSLARASVSWRLIDPVWFAQQYVWTPAAGVEHERFEHAIAFQNEQFIRSPVYHMLTNRVTQYHRRLINPAERTDFPILEDLFHAGLTDYAIYSIGFVDETPTLEVPASGLLISFASDGPNGFQDDELAMLERLRYMIALAARTALLTETTERLLSTYLARGAGRRVLAGTMTRGDGETISAAIWYCDLRRSTALNEALGTERYIGFLNDFFAATAGPVEAAGGDILDFIGDAVLAIFPLAENGVERARNATIECLLALEALRHEHADILGRTEGISDVMGLAIDIGDVVYGNIGIPERLTFSVIGGSVNQVSRIERLTKHYRTPVIVTEAIATGHRSVFRPLGPHTLDGVATPVELYALDEETVTGRTKDEILARLSGEGHV